MSGETPATRAMGDLDPPAERLAPDPNPTPAPPVAADTEVPIYPLPVTYKPDVPPGGTDPVEPPP